MSAAAASISFRAPLLPWAVALEDEARFRRILRVVLVACVLLCLALLLMPRPVEDRAAPVELPPRLAKLVLEQKPAPPPPPPTSAKAQRPCRRRPTRSRSARPANRRAGTSETVRRPVPEARQPVAGKPPGEVAESARRKAAGVGLLAMADQLAEIRGAPVAVQLQKDIKQGPGVGTGKGVGVGAGTEAGTPARALITSNAGQGSGGINTAAYSRDTGGGGLAGPRDHAGGGRGRWWRWRRARAVAGWPAKVAAAVVGEVAAAGQGPAALSPRAAAARPRARSRRSSSCSSATRARSMRFTTARCARIRRCRARWCSN